MFQRRRGARKVSANLSDSLFFLWHMKKYALARWCTSLINYRINNDQVRIANLLANLPIPPPPHTLIVQFATGVHVRNNVYYILHALFKPLVCRITLLNESQTENNSNIRMKRKEKNKQRIITPTTAATPNDHKRKRSHDVLYKASNKK